MLIYLVKMISCILITSSKGEILILRAYRDNVTRLEAQTFCNRVIAAKETRERPPIIQIGPCHYIFITVGEVLLVAMTKDNVNAALVLKFLYKLSELFRAYFGLLLDENIVSPSTHIGLAVYEATLSESSQNEFESSFRKCLFWNDFISNVQTGVIARSSMKEGRGYLSCECVAFLLSLTVKLQLVHSGPLPWLSCMRFPPCLPFTVHPSTRRNNSVLDPKAFHLDLRAA